MLLCSMCSIIPLMGANPVPPATIMMGLFVSSRRKKLPNGASMRKIALSGISLNTYSVNCPPGIKRKCSSSKLFTCGALAREKARRLPSLSKNSMYWPAINFNCSPLGNFKNNAITSCESCSLRSTRAGKIRGGIISAVISRHSIVKSESGCAQQNRALPAALSASVSALVA